MLTVADIFGGSLIAIQVTMFSFILRRVLRARSAAGVSAINESTNAGTCVTWTTYGVLIHSPVMIVSSSIGLVASTLITALALHWHPQQSRWRTWMPLLGLSLATVLAHVLAPTTGVLLLATVLGVVQYLPQWWHSLCDIHKRRDAIGVSIPGALLRATHNLMWVIWGIITVPFNIPTVIWGTVGLCAFSTQALAGILTRQRLAQTAI